MNNKIIKYKWFWAWQDDREERWLEQMSAQGYHLVEPGFFGRYVFEQGQPIKYIYRLDFISHKKDQMESYLQYFKDAGWEYLGDFGSWQYFRIVVDDSKNPEIYTDYASKIEKYRRILRILFVCILVYILPLNLSDLTTGDSNWLMRSIAILGVLLLILFSIGSYKIYKRIQELKQTIKQ